MASGAGTQERPPRKPARPIGLQVKHLEALMAIAVEGSFGGAARRLGYTQSAVSQQIAALERLVGQRLVERSKTAESPRLTPTGRLLLTHAETIMSTVYAAEADLVASRRPPCLRLGAIRSVAALLFPPALKRFRESFPDEGIEFLERAASEDILELVEGGAIDAAFAAKTDDQDRFDVHPVFSQRYVVAAPADSDLGRLGQPVSVHGLGDLPLVGADCDVELAEPDMQNDARSTRFRKVESKTLIAFVRAGLGVALVPELAIDPSEQSIVGLPLLDPIPALQIALVTHRQRRAQLPLDWLEDLARAIGRNLAPPRLLRSTPRIRGRQGTSPSPRLQVRP